MKAKAHHYRQIFVSGTVSFVVALTLMHSVISRAQTLGSAQLLMSADKTNAVPQTQINVGIGMDSGIAKVTGIDAIVYFNSNILDLTGATIGNTSLKTLVPGTSNSLDLTKAISINQSDPAKSSVSLGLVSFDQNTDQLTASISGAFNPATNPLVKLQFNAKAPGQANLSFAYTPGSTTDSNIVSLDSGTATDIMASPNSTVTITVANSSPTPIPSASVSPKPSGSASPTSTPGTCTTFDLNHDGKVDIVDITLVANRWGSVNGDPNYSAAFDLNHDGKIDVVDIQLVSNHWGEVCI